MSGRRVYTKPPPPPLFEARIVEKNGRTLLQWKIDGPRIVEAVKVKLQAAAGDKLGALLSGIFPGKEEE